MNNRKIVVKALKAMSVPVDWDTTEAIQTYTSSLYRENDRGVIILNGSTIELLLDSQLQKHMSHLNAEERDYLFGFNGPIGTFSSKIRIANALGLISRQVLHKIDLIREMRNACAHSRQEVSFQTEAVYEAVVHLGGVDKGGSQTGQYLIQGGFWGGYLDPGTDERRGMGLS